ncbi:4'-phosphopantetheinyl transferase superfamily protein [Proteobacteria bacterium 005FR1]|nr:4'-phosphopantetheinyl transferase superfamily protein [Proteobacteria bacterium 005FR1]
MISLTDNPLQLPDFCAQVSCRFNKDGYREEMREEYARELGVALPERLSDAVVKRKVEFLAGRYCARLAMARLGETPVEEIAIGEKRQPLWPQGLVGSITHSKGFASAVVARSERIIGIGIDSEQLIAEKTAANVSSHILVETETFEANRQFVDSAREYLTLVFSAKESIFKCLYPQVGQYFDFRDAEVELDSETPGQFRYRLRRHLAENYPAGFAGQGSFARAEGFVHTAVIQPL